MAFEKINGFGDNCVSAANDTLSGTAAENKALFDKAVNKVADYFNNLVTDCEAMNDKVSELAGKITDTYGGMKKVLDYTEQSEKNKIVVQGLSLSRGHVKLTWPCETREVSGKPTGYLFDANGEGHVITAYPSNIGKDVTAYFVFDFEVFSGVAKTLSYAVFANENSTVGDKSTVTETATAINIGGNATGVQFYFGSAFPVGTRLEVWGE